MLAGGLGFTTVGEELGQTLEGALFPACDDGGVDAEVSGELVDSLAATDGLDGNLGLELLGVDFALSGHVAPSAARVSRKGNPSSSPSLAPKLCLGDGGEGG